VVSTSVGGIPEVVSDGVNGLIVPPDDSGSIAAALESLDPARLEVLAAGARRVAGELSWSGYAAALERLLERVT
jgi:starch synthase